MRLKALILENFRRYHERTVIEFENLTAFIGRNDVGKSTILEALDIFFEGGTKFDRHDLSKRGTDAVARIGVIFDNLPQLLDIDRGASTNLSAEYLLNAQGNFEVHKIFQVSASRITSKVVAVANYPTNPELSELLNLKQTELRKRIKDLGLEQSCNLTENPSMRLALYRSVKDLTCSEQDVSLSDGETKNIWAALQKYMPVYALFKADRVSSDQDPEAQNPMKAAVAKAIADLTPKLDEVTAEVKRLVEETARRTIHQMQLSYPDLPIASALEPKFHDPKWANIFKIDLEADDGVPINKRGSGVRRLILMSFFQAEAERFKAERLSSEETHIPVIYAIEEPETSQHPDNQRRIIESLKAVASGGDQVIITTHNPGLAALLPTQSLRFIDNDSSTGNVRIREANDDVILEIATALGVLPDAIPHQQVKLAILTEGKTDHDALESFFLVLSEAREIPAINLSSIFWAIGGGTTVKDWVERRYLDSLGIKQICIIDSDRCDATADCSNAAQKIREACQNNPNLILFITRKRAIENYCHPDVVHRLSNRTIIFEPQWDIEFGQFHKLFGNAVTSARQQRTVEFQPIDRDGNSMHSVASSDNHCKQIITAYLMRNMTVEEIKERCAYNDNGVTKYEVIEWFQEIAKHVAA